MTARRAIPQIAAGKPGCGTDPHGQPARRRYPGAGDGAAAVLLRVGGRGASRRGRLQCRCSSPLWFDAAGAGGSGPATPPVSPGEASKRSAEAEQHGGVRRPGRCGKDQTNGRKPPSTASAGQHARDPLPQSGAGQHAGAAGAGPRQKRSVMPHPRFIPLSSALKRARREQCPKTTYHHRSVAPDNVKAVRD
jgi:hypothetical protein